MTAAVTVLAEVSLVMPCYNEEACLLQTARAILQAFAEHGIHLELVLVDNGSRDRTGEIIDELIAEGHSVAKVVVPVNQGYGHGILEGLKRCRAPFLGYLCADGQVAAEDVVRIYRLVQGTDGKVLAKVRRRFRKDGLARKIVSIGYNGLMFLIFGRLEAIDINGSPKIFSREAYNRMQLRSRDWFLDPEIMIKAKHLGLMIAELNVRGLHRQGGKSNVRWKTCVEFLKNIGFYRFGGAITRWRKSLREMAGSSAIMETGSEVTPTEQRVKTVLAQAILDGVRVLEQPRFEDARGFLQKVLTASQCAGQPPRGEVYVTAAYPGEAKGNHFHRRMGEWFAVVQGDGAVELCVPETGERRSIPLGASRPRTIFVPPGIAHAVVNTGRELLICVAWAEEEHDPSDVFSYPVWPSAFRRGEEVQKVK